MVMDNLGPSLDELLKASSDGALRLHHIAILGLQMASFKNYVTYETSLTRIQISRLKYIHSNNFIYCDIKPQNLLMGLGDLKDTVFLIDFGIAKLFRHPSSHIHISPGSTREGKSIGTPAFASLNSHFGSELSWRDDLEVLAYTLLFLCSVTDPH
jgi:serine/threonine protein kinase